MLLLLLRYKSKLMGTWDIHSSPKLRREANEPRGGNRVLLVEVLGTVHVVVVLVPVIDEGLLVCIEGTLARGRVFLRASVENKPTCGFELR